MDYSNVDPISEEFNALVPHAPMEAATKTWQAPPRKHGPDLFLIAGFEIHVIIRPAAIRVLQRVIAATHGVDRELIQRCQRCAAE
jgi:hypothetical protein